jgi:two-component sensor histidine kinase
VRRRSFSIKWHVAILGVLIFAPLITVQAILSYRIASSERETLENSVAAMAREISDVIDRDLRAAQSTLLALGTSPYLENGNIEAFHAQASRVAAIFPGSVIGLRAPGNRILTVTTQPFRAQMPLVTDPIMQQADRVTVAENRLVITDLYTGAVTGRRFVNLQVPVVTPTQTYILSFALDPAYVRDAMMRQHFDPNWVVSILDKNKVIIARSRDAERYVGQIAPKVLVDQMQDERGRMYGTTLEGTDVLIAYARSQLTGWTAVVGIPTSILRAPLNRTLWQLGLMLIAALVTAIGLAWLYSRYFTMPVMALHASTAEGAKGHRVTPIKTGISELDTVSVALSKASAEIARREDEQQLLVRELAHRVKNTLATVQAVATLSLRGATSPEAYKESIIQRVQGLARAHDVLIARNWTGTTVHEVLRAESEPFCDSTRLRVSSTDAEIRPPIAIALGMVFHELLTNAAKYGALSNANGTIDVDLARPERPDGRWIELTWTERGGAPFAPDRRRGFGTTLMTATLSNLGGTIAFEPTTDGLVVRIAMPEAADLEEVPLTPSG